LRLLFVKESLAWPRSSGHDVHCFHMMQALARMGHDIGLVTGGEPLPQAIAGLPLALRHVFPSRGEGGGANGQGPELRLSKFQERFRNYWGIDPNRVRFVGRVAEEFDAEAVVVVGLNVLPYLGAVQGRLRLWYAADEWFWHHWSQTRWSSPATWSEMRLAVVKGLYERAYGPMLDRVWVVTDADRTAMRWVAGVRAVDVIPNGVDGDHYSPVEAPQGERTCTFWGRLDFGPNVQALEWFCGRVWPLVRRQAPDARFTIYGFSPTPPVQALTGRDGVDLIPDLPDLRQEVARHQAVVLPFVSGGGIKNKLLEAASMGKAIVCSAVACRGLRRTEESPFVLASTPEEWVHDLLSLWGDAARRRDLGAAARRWVLEHHSWQAAAQLAMTGLIQSQRELRP
jgi:glycosyltransferase involved in cell wall biosynthesis